MSCVRHDRYAPYPLPQAFPLSPPLLPFLSSVLPVEKERVSSLTRGWRIDAAFYRAATSHGTTSGSFPNSFSSSGRVALRPPAFLRPRLSAGVRLIKLGVQRRATPPCFHSLRGLLLSLGYSSVLPLSLCAGDNTKRLESRRGWKIKVGGGGRISFNSIVRCTVDRSTRWNYIPLECTMRFVPHGSFDPFDIRGAHFYYPRLVCFVYGTKVFGEVRAMARLRGWDHRRWQCRR